MVTSFSPKMALTLAFTSNKSNRLSNNRFTRDYYKIMEIVYRALKQPNAAAKITGLISNVTHRLNCSP
jgi:hypothetical protein